MVVANRHIHTYIHKFTAFLLVMDMCTEFVHRNPLVLAMRCYRRTRTSIHITHTRKTKTKQQKKNKYNEERTATINSLAGCSEEKPEQLNTCMQIYQTRRTLTNWYTAIALHAFIFRTI